jgi:preprotein translocase subunit SecE
MAKKENKKVESPKKEKLVGKTKSVKTILQSK